MKRRTLWLSALLLTALVGVMGYLATQVGGPATAAADSAPSKPVGTPCAVVEDDTFDFGLMDVGEKSERVFEIRNEGTAPLKIQSGGTSCKCTLLNAPQGEIPPGERRHARLEWETVEPTDAFRHGAIIHTNDPQHPALHLIVTGRVARRCGFWPDVAAFTDLLPTERRTLNVVVYSQAWPEFRLGEVSSRSEQVTVRITEPDTRVLRQARAMSGQGLEITVEPGLSIGRHEFMIDVWPDVGDLNLAHGADRAAAPKKYELPVVCEVVGNFSIYGRHVDGTTLRMGAVRRGRPARETLSLFVRGEQRDLEFREIKVDPEFLSVAVRRDDKLQGGVARYVLEVETPRDPPLVNRMGPAAGTIELHTNHPTMPVVSFRVELATMD